MSLDVLKRSAHVAFGASLLVMTSLGGEARAQTVWGGGLATDTADGDCHLIPGKVPEIYALLLLPDDPTTTDWLWLTPRSTVGNVLFDLGSFGIPYGNFSRPMGTADRMFSFVTDAPVRPEQGGRLAVSSSDQFEPVLGAVTMQVVGETLAPTVSGYAGTGLVLPGFGTYEPVEIDWGVEELAYPRVEGDDVLLAFGALIDFQPLSHGGTPPLNCQVGGFRPLFDEPDKGAIIGYNVYSRVGHFAPSTWTADDWLAFVPHELIGPFDPPTTSTPPGIIDLDGTPYNGDEHVFFNHEGGAVVADGEPNGRWHAIQPVVLGDHFDFDASTEIARVPLGFDPKQPDGGLDLDGDGIPEFFNPHAVSSGAPGLGLTHAGRPLVSAAVYSFTPGER
ncbi:MAG: hypothetical protein AAF533_21970 [Acidobacteriota bacterium]